MSEKNLFEELKEIRIRQGIKLSALAEELRIQLKYLEALEQGELLKIPEVYDKLFFRSYLNALNTANENYYKRFLEYRRGMRFDKTTTVINFVAPEELEKKFVTSKTILVVLPLVAVLLVLWFLINNTVTVTTPAKSEVTEIDIQSMVRDMEKKEQTIADTVLPSLPLDASLKLNIRSVQRTWFRVVVDKSDTSEYMLSPGQQLDLVADQYFEFLIGRNDGLRMVMKDKPIFLPGPDSSVVRYMLIDSSGVVTKRLNRSTG